MPLLGFSVFREKLLSGEKCQTIRRPRKIPLKVGDRLYIYWHPRQKDCEKLGESNITKIQHKRMIDFNEDDAIRDGFRFYDELNEWLTEHYPTAGANSVFDIITFEPIRKEDS